MNSGLVIKPYSDENMDSLVSLIHLIVEECYPKVYEPEIITYFKEYHSKSELLRKSKDEGFLLAFFGNELVGSGFLFEDEIGGVYVHPEHQKKGIGTALVRSLIEVAKRKGLSRIWLTSTPLAVDLYKSAGFEIVKEMVDYVGNDVPLPYFYMQKEL